MYEFEGDQDTLISGVVRPKARVAWSRRRAWHGETVTIQVRTELVIDGTEVKLEIRRQNGGVIATFGQETITGNRLDKEYKIDWRDLSLKEKPHTFLVRVASKDPFWEAESAAMTVDLAPPLFSA